MDVSASDISAAYQENEAKAQMTYGEKPLRVTGTVKDISLDFMDEPVIGLKGANDTQNMGINTDGKMTDVSISGLSQEDAAAVEKGAEMTFLCTGVGEMMGGARLEGCSAAN